MVCNDTSGDAVDSGGDSCAWYEGKAEYCGMFADDDFNSATDCCVCGGGELIVVDTPTPEEEPLEIVCTDTNAGMDSGNDGCSWYSMYPEYCGNYDDEDFTASSMCCSCGGGSTMVEVDGAVEDALEALIIEIEQPHTEEEVEETVE